MVPINQKKFYKNLLVFLENNLLVNYRDYQMLEAQVYLGMIFLLILLLHLMHLLHLKMINNLK